MTLPPQNGRPIRIGVQIQPQHANYEAIRDAVQRAEDLGVDIIFNWDHFYPLTGDPAGAHFECWTMLGAWAEQTKTVEIGALVSCNAYRNPQLLADMVRTVDHISAGRLIFGIGSGWFERDFTEYGYEFGTAGSRLDNLAEAMELITSRLAALNPPPTRAIPVLIGGGGEKKTLRLVAKHATIWHSFAGAAELPHKLEVLAGHAADVGRDLSAIEISVGVGGPGREGRLPDSPQVEGEPLRQLGASLFTMGISGPDYDLSVIEPWIQWRDELNGSTS